MKDISISLSKEEAIVLFDLLCKISKAGTVKEINTAEDSVLNDILCELESCLVEPLQPDFACILQRAYDSIVKRREL